MHPCAGHPAGHPQRECVHTNKTFPSCVVTVHAGVLIMSFDLIAMQPSWACHSCVSHRQDVRECNGAG